MFSLHYSRTKRYLTGVDWMINTLDHVTKKETGVGNVSQIVLEINGTVDGKQLEDSLRAFLARYPIVSGYCKRDYNLAPYWYIPAETTLDDFAVRTFRVAGDKSRDAVFDVLIRGVNRPFGNIREHVAFTIVYHGGKTFVAMQFDHRLLDARGAEMFLAKFNSFVGNGMNDDLNEYTEPAHLDRWKEKFDAGKQVNRMFLSLREEVPPSALPLPGKKDQRVSAYSFKSYSQEESDRIARMADKKTGYLMMMPYFLGATVWCMHRVFCDRGRAGKYYVVPANLDARLPGQSGNQLFFNYISFLYFKFSSAISSDIQSLWNAANEQFYDYVKGRLADRIAQASMLMRIVPLGILGALMRIPLRGHVASFSFSYIGKDGYESDVFMGLNIENIYHMPRVPTPPGLGVFFTRFKGRFNVVFSFPKGMFSSDETNAFMSRLDSILRNGNANGNCSGR